MPIVYQNTPFEFHPEDGHIKKPKHVADLIIFNYIYYKGCVRLKIWIHFYLLLKTTGMPHLGNAGLRPGRTLPRFLVKWRAIAVPSPLVHTYISIRGLVLGFISISHVVTYTVTVKLMDGFGLVLRNFALLLMIKPTRCTNFSNLFFE